MIQKLFWKILLKKKNLNDYILEVKNLMIKTLFIYNFFLFYTKKVF